MFGSHFFFWAVEKMLSISSIDAPYSACFEIAAKKELILKDQVKPQQGMPECAPQAKRDSC